MVLSEEIEQLKSIIKGALMREWEAQGHRMTGAAIERITYTVDQVIPTDIIVNVFMPKYALIIDEGVPANRIPFAPGSGARRSLYIEGLTRYAQQRMNILNLKEAKSVAFAIAYTQKREGMPTEASRRFSGTGKRTQWFEEAINKNLQFINEWARMYFREFITVSIQKILKKYK